FSKGKYNLSDVEAYIATLPGTELYESEFLQNSTKTKGNVIAGNLTMQKSGYLITSIPYDSGFKIQVDGKNVKR
ncbi:YfhO family protein, partial [Thomasclavelia ramosa]|uniref:YfhO family protein n=1 Tax=Thomasclavelia ramosa TaxID=1547 RepID=UPI001D02313D